MADETTEALRSAQQDLHEALADYEAQLKRLKLKKEDVVKNFARQIEALEVERMKRRISKRIEV